MTFQHWYLLLLFLIPSITIRINLPEFTGPDSYLSYCLLIASCAVKWHSHRHVVSLQLHAGFCAVCVRGNVTQKWRQGVGLMGRSGQGLESPILWNGRIRKDLAVRMTQESTPSHLWQLQQLRKAAGNAQEGQTRIFPLNQWSFCVCAKTS